MVIDWQPIETAPKNPEGERSGPKVLLWDKYYGHAVTAIWTTDKDFRGCVRSGWWEAGPSGRGYLHSVQLTHWAPLTPPAEGEE